MHSLNLIHRDIKSLNFLVDKQWKVKLADFGESKDMEDVGKSITNQVGTLRWSSPELLEGKSYDFKTDIYR